MTRPKGSRNIPWAQVIATARSHPGRWLALPELAAVPWRTINVIRRRERPQLRMPDGVLRCRRSAAVTVEGRTLVGLLIKFEKGGSDASKAQDRDPA